MGMISPHIYIREKITTSFSYARNNVEMHIFYYVRPRGHSVIRLARPSAYSILKHSYRVN